MTEGDRAHPGAPGQTTPPPPKRRRRGRTLLLALVLLLVVAGAAGVVAWRYDLAERWGIVEPAPDPTTDPAAVPAPPEVELPDAATAAPVAKPLVGTEPREPAVRRALGRLTEAKRLGKRVAVVVADDHGRVVHSEGPGTVTPASTMKLLTGLAALQAVGQDQRFTTEVVRKGTRVTLVGGGDPLLARRADPDFYPEQADVVSLARQAAKALREDGATRVRLGYDDSLFSGPVASPTWEPDYLPDDVVSPITALWVDEGRERAGFAGRSADPSADAARFFAQQLRRQGITVAGDVQEADARGKRIAAVQSAPLVEVLQHVLEISDNEGAEVLARQVAVAEGEPASFDGAARAVEDVLRRVGVPMQGAEIHDGSGLSRDDRLRTSTLLGVLAASASPDHAALGGLLEGLPVAGFSGSLSYRFDVASDDGLGWVRAKTGTLVSGGVHGLAGVVTGRDRTVMTFVAIADRVKPVNTEFVRVRLDQIAAALADCRCG